MWTRILCIWMWLALMATVPVLAQDQEPGEPEEVSEPDDSAAAEPGEEAAEDSAKESTEETAEDSKEEPPAKTEDKPGVKVILLDTYAAGKVPTKDALDLQGVIRSSLESLGHVKLQTEAGLLDERSDHTPPEVAKDLVRVEKLIQQGREHLLNLALDDGADAFLSARVILRRHMKWLNDPERLITTLMGLAETLAASDRKQEAKAAYREVLVVAPDYVPDPGQVPGKFRSLFDEASEEASDEPTGSLDIQSNPPDASVVLDGLRAGETPLIRDRIPGGLHTLLVNKEGYRPVRKTVEVTGGEIAREAIELAPELVHDLVRRLHEALQTGASPKDTMALAADLARITEHQVVILSQVARNRSGHQVLTAAVVRVDQNAPRVFGVLVPAGNRFELGPQIAGQISELLDESRKPGLPDPGLGMDFTRKLLGEPASAQTVATASLVRVPKTEIQEEGPRPELPPVGKKPGTTENSDSIFKTWWFWTGAAAVVAAAVGTTLALTLGGETETILEPDQIHIIMEKVQP
jgi:hypothetical protein